MAFELVHIGINDTNDDASVAVMKAFITVFGLPSKPGNSSNFAGTDIEIMKSMYLDDSGHIAIKTNSKGSAVVYLEKKGFKADNGDSKIYG